MRNLKTQVLAGLMTLAMLSAMLTTAVFADQSTTTLQTAYKSLDANTEIYALTNAPGGSYPYYGALHEPNGGVLYGRTAQGGSLPGGGYGLVNLNEAADESVISFYYSMTDSYSLEYWSYIYGAALADGEHALLIYLNFDKEGDDCAAVTSGAYDAKLREAFSYLHTLSCPVFLRIGGEVNVWTVSASPESYIAAYRHIASLARSLSPNVALVFSPNYTSSYTVDMDAFYPGDQYVDWVGASLYYNRYANNSDAARDAFYGVGDQYGDPLLNVQQTVNLSRLHNKPIIITEGGSANRWGDQDLSGWVAERMQKAYAFLPMVYPQIKAVVSSDYVGPNGANSYEFYTNSTVTSAYRQGVRGAGVYLSSYGGAAAYLTPLSDNPDLDKTTGGSITFTAYTYSPTRLTATWTLDGQSVGSGSGYPYSVTLDREKVLTGSHILAVSFSNGQTKSYTVGDPSQQPPEVPSDWAVGPVNAAIAAGFVPAGFQSNYSKTTTRAEFATLAVTLYEVYTGTQITPTATFTDTSDLNVCKAATVGVVSGLGDGRFGPENPLTREAAATMLSNLAKAIGQPMPESAPTFADNASISGWATGFVGQVQAAGIMSGTGANKFSPADPYTREQSITTMNNLHQYLK